MVSKQFVIGMFVMMSLCIMMVSAGYPARALEDEIKNLPDATLASRQFSGYISIANGTTDMFYWFVEAENNPETAPIFWVSNGGPGCSGLLGFFTEWGPFQPIKSDDKIKLAKRQYGWAENFNLVFVEQPDVGFTNIAPGKAPSIWNDDLVAERNSDFIAGFFERFTNLKSNPFGILSESMGGHYIPRLADRLIRDIANSPRHSFINFQYSLVGNPLVYLPYRDYGYYAMLIDRHLVPYFPLGKQYKETCMPDPTKQPYPPQQLPSVCSSLEYQMDKYTVAVDPYAMSFPMCVDSKTGTLKSSSPYLEYFAETLASAQQQYKSYTALDQLEAKYDAYNQMLEKSSQGTVDALLGQITGVTQDNDHYFPPNYQPCEEDYTVTYLNRKDVQEAIHANLKRARWDFCASCRYDNKSFGESMIPYYKSNYKNRPNLKQVVFSGTDDTMCSTVEADMAFFNNDFKQKSQEVMLTPEGQMLGIETVFEELTYLTEHGGGHMLPSTRPYFSKYAVERYVLGKK